jgi:3-dehydrosphinganine reductase
MNSLDAHFRDKAVLITGGSSGIGLALAQQLAAAGAHVWLLARRKQVLEAALAKLPRSAGQRCGIVSADVSNWKQVQAAVARMEREVSLPDLLVNSAGETHPGYVQDIPLEIFEKLMDINYLGTVYAIRAVLPGMIARGSGHIINISSITGFLGVFGYTAYGATKYAVRGFSDALRAEVKPLGVRVSIVFPPDTDTPQLAYENQFKPPETKALAGIAGGLSPEVVAGEILRDAARGRYIILPGFEAKLFYRLNDLIGNAVYPLMDWLVRDARRSINLKK